MIWGGRKRRQFLRRSCHLVAWVKMQGKEPGEAIIQNIGGGGTDLIMKEQPEVSSIVGIELLLPDEEQSIKCRGKVSWYQEHYHLFPHKMTDYEVGIAFEDLEDDTRDRIVRFAKEM
ncbi:MAG: PilZ domain-containing protein [Nitrospirae bacterium]|nr:PilZ domain-containing protein [Nitrospirota bacterium]